jgi:periplasmic protein TonB
LLKAMSSIFYLPMSAASDPVALPLLERSLAVMLVVFAHGLLLWSWAAAPGHAKSAHHRMSISIEMLSPPPVSVPNSVLPIMAESKPVESNPIKPDPIELELAQPVSRQITGQASALPSSVMNNSSAVQSVVPGLPDREPDYQAAYLNNPRPDYPMVARRMGWHGRVVLNVEVLANGLPGQVIVEHNSGHEILDNAAVRAVRGWRFVAARNGGQIVTQRFLVPITFNLKDSE